MSNKSGIGNESFAAESMVNFLIGSWFLYESFAYCTQPRFVGRQVRQNDEWVHYATGIVMGQTRIIDKMITFDLSTQSQALVEGDPLSTRDALINLANYGYQLTGVFHSHPSSGRFANHPSSIDIDHQRRLELGGYRALTGIFSRDGYVRCMALGFPYKVNIYGSGVEQIDEHNFLLTEIDHTHD